MTLTSFRRPLLITAAAFVAMLLYPPHVFDLGINGRFSGGYAFILDPPIYNSRQALIDVQLLFVQAMVVVIVVVCIAFAVAAKGEPKRVEIEGAGEAPTGTQKVNPNLISEPESTRNRFIRR